MSCYVYFQKVRTCCFRVASCAALHLLSGAAFGKQGLEPLEIIRCPGKHAYQVICSCQIRQINLKIARGGNNQSYLLWVAVYLRGNFCSGLTFFAKLDIFNILHFVFL